MEKVKIRKCESIMNGSALALEFIDGSKATAWDDKVDCKTLKLAYDTMSEIEVEREPYTSKKGKSGFNIIKIFPDLQTIYDAEQGNASANGQYQKATFGLNAKRIEMPKPEITGTAPMIPKPLEFPKPEDFGEADITSINAKSSVKIKKNSKGIGWEIKVVTGEINLIDDLGRAALKAHKDMSKEFPAETVHVA